MRAVTLSLFVVPLVSAGWIKRDNVTSFSGSNSTSTGYPSCAVQCFSQAQNETTVCPSTYVDVACLCSRPEVTGFIDSCLDASCDTNDMEAAIQYGKDLCQAAANSTNSSTPAPTTSGDGNVAATSSDSVSSDPATSTTVALVTPSTSTSTSADTSSSSSSITTSTFSTSAAPDAAPTTLVDANPGGLVITLTSISTSYSPSQAPTGVDSNAAIETTGRGRHTTYSSLSLLLSITLPLSALLAGHL